ncbi:MAG: SMC-Scp complex subunit ScpB [Faecalibacterium sp.]|nr:SMC-Scp complex subunit ScpB [Ruminococcus sp.]MCM1392240.1 SMC-Scp complex subunit ScpB [Ruminococcus sp.]MCM1484943.1 SMC-Scp complex subunit ScpB [Faecalibacterium sp.]
MNLKKMQSMLEAVLFAVAEPIELERLASALEIDELTLEEVLKKLQTDYEERDSGLRLLKLENKYQLCSAKQYADEIRMVLEVKRNTPLSQAAFEVLAVIAYNQPVTKAFIEQVRGVDCSGVISSLCQKQLIEEKGRLDLPGRPLIYGTTANFLRCFCVSSLDELPSLPDKSVQNEVITEKSEENSDKQEADLSQSVDEN